jgi:tRNA-splicing endonuclease subunit sen54 N-term
MADASEDLLLPAIPGRPAPPPRSDDPTAPHDDDAEDGDEVVDFRFLAALATSAGQQGKIPTRGLKDFEPHGTRLQSSALDASRDAMHAVLREERVHAADDRSVAVWDPEGGGAWVVRSTGKWATGVGRSRRVAVAKDDDEDDAGEAEAEAEEKQKVVARLWLLPEETLWLLERGTIDLRWPSAEGEADGEGLPMSLQAAHAMLLGRPRADGFTLERFTVYQYLKRAGYHVQRAEENWHNVPAGAGGWWAVALLGRLLRAAGMAFSVRPTAARGAGPLVTPGLYRDYSTLPIPCLETASNANRVDIPHRLDHPVPLPVRHAEPDQPVLQPVRSRGHRDVPRLQADHPLPQDRPRPAGLLRQRRQRPDAGAAHGDGSGDTPTPDAVHAA